MLPITEFFTNFRHTNSYTMADMSTKLKVSQSYYHAIEHGYKQLSKKALSEWPILLEFTKEQTKEFYQAYYSSLNKITLDTKAWSQDQKSVFAKLICKVIESPSVIDNINNII